MTSPDEILFGRIVELSGLASPEQIQECVALQSDEPDVPLGEMLRRKGYLSPDQLDTVLAIQTRNLSSDHPDTDRSLEESLFGKLVLLKRLARAGEVHECLRLQQSLKEHGQHTFLGELLVMKGRMSAAQVASVLKDQNRMVLFCEACLQRIQVPEYDPSTTYHCDVCHRPLSEPIPVELADREPTEGADPPP